MDFRRPSADPCDASGRAEATPAEQETQAGIPLRGGISAAFSTGKARTVWPGRRQPKEALIKLARAGRRGFFRHKEARNRRNTLCISRLSNEFVAEKDRRLPKTHLISASIDGRGGCSEESGYPPRFSAAQLNAKNPDRVLVLARHFCYNDLIGSYRLIQRICSGPGERLRIQTLGRRLCGCGSRKEGSL